MVGGKILVVLGIGFGFLGGLCIVLFIIFFMVV